MRDESRLTQVGQLLDHYRQSHSHPNAFACCTAHAVADQVPDLLAEVNRLRARVSELEAAQTAFLLPWAHQLDAKSLDNFVGDLARAADAPLLFVVDEIHQTVAQWRELAGGKVAEGDVKADVA